MIPNKSNFRFQELPPITGVKPYVIRFWETEFSEISPSTNESGDKIYERKDVEAILKVKKLLFDEKLTIIEAKARMSQIDIENEQQLDSNIALSYKNFQPHVIAALELILKIKARRNW